MSLKVIINAIFKNVPKDWKQFLINSCNDTSKLYTNFEIVLKELNKLKLTNRKEAEYMSIFNCFKCDFSNVRNVVLLNNKSEIDNIEKKYKEYNLCKDNTLIIDNSVFTKLWDEWVESLIKKLSDEKKNIVFIVPLAFGTLGLDSLAFKKNINNKNTILTYSNTILDNKILINEITIYTDGSSVHNGTTIARGGYSVVIQIKDEKTKIQYGRVPIGEYNDKLLYPTNIRAEGYAILKAINYVNKKYNYKTCTIVSDSKFWIDMIEVFIPKWPKDKFEKNKNTDLTLQFKNINIKKIKFIFVRSHGKEKTNLHLIQGNELADKYASKGNSSTKETNVITL